jgi:hypothetical protein
MKRKGIKFLLLKIMTATVFSGLFGHLSFAQMPGLSKTAWNTIIAETQFNPEGYQSNLPIQLEHIEVSASAVQFEILEKADPLIRQALVFQTVESGETVQKVRLILNPDDGVYKNQIIEYFKNSGIAFSVEKYFVGYRTASRSFIVTDPKTGKVFSYKASTPKAFGPVKTDKKLSAKAVKASLLLSDYVRQNPPTENMTVRFLPETMGFSISQLDLGFSVREYPHFKNSNGNFLVPFFSTVHSEFAEFVAKKNGSKKYEQFWTEHAMKPVGQALAEMVFNYGIVYNSSHGQNIMIELDADYKPTGKIYLRDFSDSDLFEKVFIARGRTDIVDYWEDVLVKNNVYKYNQLPLVEFFPFNKETQPDWLRETKKYMQGFVSGFKLAVSRLLQVSDVSGFNAIITEFSARVLHATGDVAFEKAFSKHLEQIHSTKNHCHSAFN